MPSRKRYVFPTDEIPHLWANRHDNGGPARNPQGNLSFAGGTLKSYAEPIGRLITAKGRTVALFRDASWSVTTSRHQFAMRQAVRHYAGFTVPDIGQSRITYDAKAHIGHKQNLKSYAERIDAAALAAKRSRSNRDYAIGTLTRLVDEANGYAEMFGLKRRFIVPDDSAVVAMLADARAAAKRERAAEVERQRRLTIAAADALAEWLAGGTGHYPTLRTLSNAHLRLEGDEVVTTQGARVPVDHVRRALPIILRLIDRGESWKTNGHTIHIGHYQLDEITADGLVRAGCHLFKSEEVRRFAGVLGA